MLASIIAGWGIDFSVLRRKNARADDVELAGAKGQGREDR